MVNSRRNFIGGSAFGIFGVLPLSKSFVFENLSKANLDKIHPLYPSIDPKDARAIVGASHTNIEGVKEMVKARPELAKASYDWGFGDWESALGAASHMGRKDIAEFLINNGARPNLFTLAMLGKLEAVKATINEMPGIESIAGPHGFNLLHHAMIRIRRNNVAGEEKVKQEALVAYLQTLPGADQKAKSLEMTTEEQMAYYGKYVFGEGSDEYFVVNSNSMKFLSISRADYTGRSLLRQDGHVFAPGGAPSVRVIFEMVDGKPKSLTIHDLEPVLKAVFTN